MTCKDCLHFKVCEYEGIYFEDWAIEASSADGIEDLCPQFENKADFVEVVRCKNCGYSYGTFTEMYCKMHTVSSFDGGEDAEVDADDFCSYGKRRDE